MHYEIKQNLIEDSCKFSIKYKAICKEKDLKSEWRTTEKEAVHDAIEHQKKCKSHVLEIHIQQTNSFISILDKNS